MGEHTNEKTEWTDIPACQSFWIISNISFGMPMLAFSVFSITQEKVPYLVTSSPQQFVLAVQFDLLPRTLHAHRSTKGGLELDYSGGLAHFYHAGILIIDGSWRVDFNSGLS